MRPEAVPRNLSLCSDKANGQNEPCDDELEKLDKHEGKIGGCCASEQVNLPQYLVLIVTVAKVPLAAFARICALSRCVSAKFDYFAGLPAKAVAAVLHWLESLVKLWSEYRVSCLLVSGLAAYYLPVTAMTYPLFALLRLFLGTLYPAYASFKAVRTKNVREYVKWMMYWIVFATFTGIETFTDIFVAFWFPFYYELKIFVLIWLISPVSSGSLGSSILYRKFVHPFLVQREDEIDRMMSKFQEQGYNTVTRLGMQAFSYISETVLQTAIRMPGLVHELMENHQGRRQLGVEHDRMQTEDTTDFAGRFSEVEENGLDAPGASLDENDLIDETERSLKSKKLPGRKKKPAAAKAKQRTKKKKRFEEQSQSSSNSIEFSSDSDAANGGADIRDMDPFDDPDVTMAIMGPPKQPDAAVGVTTRKRRAQKPRF